jgi:hypothetical protein
MIQTELSADTRAVVDLLSACPVDGTVSIQAISDRLGRDVRRYRHVIAAARRVVAREAGGVFVSVRGIGYRRLSADRAAEVLAPASRKHIRMTARRTRRNLEQIISRANDMAPEARLKASREIGVLGVIEHIAREANVSKMPSPDTPQPVAVMARAALAAITGESA